MVRSTIVIITCERCKVGQAKEEEFELPGGQRYTIDLCRNCAILLYTQFKTWIQIAKPIANPNRRRRKSEPIQGG